jgi:6-phosphogluconolactonase
MKNLLISIIHPVLGLLAAALFHSCGTPETNEMVRFYVGSSDGSLEHPIFLCEYDPVQEQFSVLDSFAGAVGPSYLDLSPDSQFLYVIDKTMADDREGSMQVTAFSRIPETGHLSYLNSQPSEGLGPCHIHCNAEGNYLFTSNYTSGNVAAFPLDERGLIMPASSVAESEGSGPVRDRQEGPHTHYVTLDPRGAYLLSPDLGTDKLLIFGFDNESGTLSPNPDQPFFRLEPGSGPRHMVFHPEGTFLYIANELNATVTACSYDPAVGMVTELNTLSTVAEDHEGSKYPAAIRISPDGRFVYVSTRGEISSIAAFRVESDGSLSTLEVVENVPGWPRDFNIDPSGRLLLVAGERSHEIELYHRDINTGKLTRSGIGIDLPSPGCILFTP